MIMYPDDRDVFGVMKSNAKICKKLKKIKNISLIVKINMKKCYRNREIGNFA